MNPVLRLLLHRLAISVLVLVGVSILIFFIARIVPIGVIKSLEVINIDHGNGIRTTHTTQTFL